MPLDHHGVARAGTIPSSWKRIGSTWFAVLVKIDTLSCAPGELRAAYSGHDMPDREARIDAVVFDHQVQISLSGTRFPAIRLWPSTQYFTLDVFTLDAINDLIYGEPFGYLATNEDVLSSLQNIRTILALHFLAMPFPLLTKLLGHPWMFKMAGRMVRRFGFDSLKG